MMKQISNRQKKIVKPRESVDKCTRGALHTKKIVGRKRQQNVEKEGRGR